MYSLSARLAYYLNKDGFFSNVGTLSSDETISYLAGWFGDATLIADDGYTSFKNDDYIADLDAENIYRLIITNKDNVLNSIIEYQQNIQTQSRARIFLNYISLDTVKSMIFQKFNLDDKMTSDQKMDFLKINQPDTYNFIMSLTNQLNTMEEYV